MAKTSDQNKTAKLMDTWASSRIAVFGQVSVMTVLGMALLAGGGYFLDNALGTFPGFFIAGIVIAFPLIQFLIYKKIKSYAVGRTNNLE